MTLTDTFRFYPTLDTRTLCVGELLWKNLIMKGDYFYEQNQYVIKKLNNKKVRTPFSPLGEGRKTMVFASFNKPKKEKKMTEKLNYLSDELIIKREKKILASKELNSRKEAVLLMDIGITAKTLANMDAKGCGILDRKKNTNRLGGQVVYTKKEIIAFLWYAYSDKSDGWIEERLKKLNFD